MNRRSMISIKNLLKFSDLEYNLDIVMNQTRIDKFFFNSNDITLEDIHDDVHNIIGYPMNSLHYAAFTLEFWLHHCFIDLLLESYINHNKKIKKKCIFCI